MARNDHPIDQECGVLAIDSIIGASVHKLGDDHLCVALAAIRYIMDGRIQPGFVGQQFRDGAFVIVRTPQEHRIPRRVASLIQSVDIKGFCPCS